jgi:hypothetical protein
VPAIAAFGLLQSRGVQDWLVEHAVAASTVDHAPIDSDAIELMQIF